MRWRDLDLDEEDEELVEELEELLAELEEHVELLEVEDKELLPNRELEELDKEDDENSRRRRFLAL